MKTREPSTCLMGLYHEPAGLPHHVENLARSLSRLTRTSVVALRPDRGGLVNDLGVEYRHLPTFMKRWPTVQGALLGSVAKALGALPKADVFHAHHPIPSILLRGASPWGCVIQTVHDIPSLDARTFGARIARSRSSSAMRLIERATWPRMDSLIAVHRELADWILANLPVGKDSVQVIPNGVDVDRFHPDADGARAVRARLGVADDDFLVLCMKTLHKDDLPTVLRAAASIVDPKFRLVLPWRDRTSSLPEMVQLSGIRHAMVIDRIPYADTPSYYAAADLIVLPYLKRDYDLGGLEMFSRPAGTLREMCRAGFASVTSLTAMEAFASGTPTIVSVPGSETRIDPAEIGGVVPAWDPEALAGAMRVFAEKPQSTRMIGAQARQFVGEEFTWDRIAARTLEVYRKVAS